MFGIRKNKSSAPDYMIVGLGNPGLRYQSTRHNSGFVAIDALAQKHRASITKSKYKALIGEANIGGRRCILVKPQTFMNNSGEAVRALARFYCIPTERILLLFDDVSLPVGAIRVRRGGSHGGQNGVRSIIDHMGSEDFPRVKIGIGAKPHPDYDLADWVLSKFRANEQAAFDEAVAKAMAAVPLIVGGEIEQAMGIYNERGTGHG